MRAGSAWEEHTAVIPYVAVEVDPHPQEPGRELVVEARLTWAGSVLAITHAALSHGALRVRDLDLPVHTDLDLVLARGIDGRTGLVLPGGEPVPSGCRMTLRLGRALLRVSLVPAEASAVPRAQSDGRLAKGVLLGAVIHGTVLAMAILGRAPVGDQEAASASQVAMSGYLAAIEARSELAEAMQAAAVAAPSPEAGREKTDSPSSSGKRREEGAAGNPARVTEGGLAAKTRGVDRFSGRPGAEKPETFGMIALLESTKEGKRAGSSAFADFEGPGAMGSIFGAKIDDAAGFGGLGLSGPGEGGGGKGAGVPLAGIGPGSMLSGTCDATCMGMHGGHASHGIRMRGTHTTRSPSIRCGVELDTAGVAHETCATQVNGRLPPEAVQRVVRQSFGRLRACYEAGLQRDPGLEGRIAVKFVIDREGAVSMASVADRDLPDAEVAACVARAYTSMSFPKPEGGIVTVVYPVVFGS